MDFIKTFIQAYNMLFLSLVLFYALECFVCICVYVYHVPAWGLQRSEDPDLLELEFQTVTRHPMGMGSRTRSSGRATIALNSWATSPAPCKQIHSQGPSLTPSARQLSPFLPPYVFLVPLPTSTCVPIWFDLWLNFISGANEYRWTVTFRKRGSLTS